MTSGEIGEWRYGLGGSAWLASMLVLLPLGVFVAIGLALRGTSIFRVLTDFRYPDSRRIDFGDPEFRDPDWYQQADFPNRDPLPGRPGLAPRAGLGALARSRVGSPASRQQARP